MKIKHVIGIDAYESREQCVHTDYTLRDSLEMLKWYSRSLAAHEVNDISDNDLWSDDAKLRYA